MNLYKIMFIHYSPRDSQKGILTYLVANTDEEVYEWLKSDPKLPDEMYIFTTYKDSERDEESFNLYDDEYNIIGNEFFKERIVRMRGDMFDKELELNDLYYGRTLFGWGLVKEDVKNEDLSNIKDNGIEITFPQGAQHE
ncbi:hypothetical protein EBB07_28255 [Paenibacillaceae bacterium]|nr:hypothetical protein EBB07_28255 [Paenibacillaceae bacterium]